MKVNTYLLGVWTWRWVPRFLCGRSPTGRLCFFELGWLRWALCIDVERWTIYEDGRRRRWD